MTKKDIVIGVDSSTQSTKAIAWSPTGEALAEGRAPIPAANPGPGLSEQDPEDWWGAACAALKAIAEAVEPARIAGVAISNQRETLGFFDAEGRATHPALVWIDERGRDEIGPAAAALGRERIHEITGKPVDMTPALYRIAWMNRHRPEAMARSARLCGVHDFLSWRLTGRPACSLTSADPLGLLDIAAGQWSAPILDYLGLDESRLSALATPGTLIGGVTAAASAATGLPEGTPLYAGGGDGQCAGLGVDAARPGVVYLNLGTALIAGAWSAEPATSRYWRTMTSPTGEGYFLEAVQRAGTYLVDWVVRCFSPGGDGVFATLEAEAAALPIGSAGVVMSPYLTGCMDPHWDPDARAAIEGLGPDHRVAHIFRAALEALTLESVRGMKAMAERGVRTDRIVAVGGGAANRLWTRMFADASGLPLTTSVSNEASALGAGMSAAVGAGWHGGFADTAAAMRRYGETIEPDLAQVAAWAALSERQAAVYRRC